MLFSFYFVYSLLLFCIHTTAQSATPFVKQLYRFPNGTSIEDVLVLRNGSLLLALITEPSLYRLDLKSSSAPVLVKRFSAQTSLLGIAQLNKTTVAVIAGNTTSSEENIYPPAVPGSFVVYLLHVCGKIVASFPIPEASRLESITTLPDAPQYLLISDPILKVIWRLDTRTGVVDKAITDFLFGPGEAGDPGLGGIEAAGQYLYFIAQNQASLARIRITPDGRSKGDPPQTRFFPPRFYALDDLAIGPNGTIFINDQYMSTVIQVKSSSSSTILDGVDVDHPTAIAFAGNIMYVVTAGFQPAVGGTGGQVVRVDLGRLSEPDLTGSGPIVLSSSSSGFQGSGSGGTGSLDDIFDEP